MQFWVVTLNALKEKSTVFDFDFFLNGVANAMFQNMLQKYFLKTLTLSCLRYKLCKPQIIYCTIFPNVLFKKYVKKTKNMPARNAHLYYVNAKLLPVGIFFQEIFACLHHQHH